MNHFFKSVLLILSILITTNLFANFDSSLPKKDNYSKKIDSLIQIVNPRNFNGVVYIQQNGKEKYAKSFGASNLTTNEPLKINDNFSTMSIAKQFTATLVLQEVEKGTIDLHVPIRNYLSDFNYSWADTVTVHHLLNNTSGLDSESLDQPLKFKPGTAFSYSNIGYYVAGLVLEKQSGKSFEELVTTLFKKCEMHNSYYPNEINNTLLTKGHTIKEDRTFVLNKHSNFTPKNYFGSHLLVTAPDLARWNEKLHNGKLLKPATYKMMTSYTITNQHQVFGDTPIGYGYGLRINDKAALSEIGHTGFHPREGFTAVNLYYPETKTSVVIMENIANENFDVAYYFEQEIRTIVMESTLVK